MGENMSTHAQPAQTMMKRSCGQLKPTAPNNLLTPFTFPLFESKVYSIGSSNSCDYKIPAKWNMNEKILLRVDQWGGCEIENLTSVPVQVDGKEVKASYKAKMKEDTKTIQLGEFTFQYNRNEVPSTTQLKHLYAKLQCVMCFQFPVTAKNLPCNHILCQTCSQKMISNALSTTQNVTAELSRGNTRTVEVRVTCPLCSKVYPVSEIIDVPPEPAVSKVTTFFYDVTEDRPVCGACQNQRWIIHGSSYVMCSQCKIFLCTLCALDGHRNHQLKSTFSSAHRSRREFEKKVANAKQMWIRQSKSIQETLALSSKAKQMLVESKSQLSSMKNEMNERLGVLKENHKKLVSLEAPSFSETIDKDRDEMLEIFEDNMYLSHNAIEDLIQVLTSKAEETVLAFEALSADNSSYIELDYNENNENEKNEICLSPTHPPTTNG